ncbi:hypothetical protein OF83DRAFT_1027850, partial [Amylostereum chailletii]
MITLVVEPTNFLERSLVMNTDRKGVTSLVINSDTLKQASLEGRDLWQEAKAGLFQVITLAPESLQHEKFAEMMNNDMFCSRWRVLTVDEAHLVDEWGSEFRPLYKEIKRIRALAPAHVTIVALSASVEPGAQMNRILEHLGLEQGHFYLDKRDTRRTNVDISFRDVEYTYSGDVFHDLDWTVPADMKSVMDVPKRLIYCPTIEVGHRVTLYL